MGKSKNTTVFTLEDGRRVIFNQAAFEYQVNRMAESINRKNGKNRGGKAEVFRLIATELRHPHSDDLLESTISLIKNWYNGNNGPSDPLDIQQLAEIFDLEKNAFFKEMKEEKKMNATAEMVNVSIDQNKIINALKAMKERLTIKSQAQNQGIMRIGRRPVTSSSQMLRKDQRGRRRQHKITPSVPRNCSVAFACFCLSRVRCAGWIV